MPSSALHNSDNSTTVPEGCDTRGCAAAGAQDAPLRLGGNARVLLLRNNSRIRTLLRATAAKLLRSDSRAVQISGEFALDRRSDPVAAWIADEGAV